ncbi:MAG: hypothetical protein AB8C46_20060 [Burkholderiaceae bacterium]
MGNLSAGTPANGLKLTKATGAARFLITGACIAALAACGGNDSSSTANDGANANPGTEDSDHGGDGEFHIDTMGRLAIHESGAASVRVLELDNKEMIATIATANPVSALHASPDRRYAVAVQRNQDLVEFIDGGIWQEDHGDHLHDYREDPVAMSYRLEGVRPTHYESHDELAAIFNDGLADTNTNATVTVISDVGIATDRTEATLDLPMQMHGTAEPRGRYLLTTWRAPDNRDTLPEQVELYVYEESGYQLVTRFEETCPRLHGSFANESHTAFGCEDGVLVVSQSGDTFTASKLANPAGLPEDVRIGSVYGHHDSVSFIGFARPGYLFEIDPVANEIHPITWPGQQVVTTAFANEGKSFLVMDEAGTVHMLDATAGWSVSASVPAASGIPEEGSQPSIEPHGHEPAAYVSDPLGKRIVVLDLASGSASDTIAVEFAPGQVRWLGIAEDEHDHDGEHDHDE